MTSSQSRAGDKESYSYPSILTPGRKFCLTENDLRRFNELLVDAFPDICFFANLGPRQRRATSPRPASVASPWISDLFGGDLTYHFDGPDWKPQWALTGHYPAWNTTNVPMPNGLLRVGGNIEKRISDSDPEAVLLSQGILYTRCDKGNDDHMRIARKVRRLITKVATNTKQQVWNLRTMTPGGRTEKGSDFWIGHEAREWLLAKPNRFTDYQSGWATRPYENWAASPGAGSGRRASCPGLRAGCR
jgi:hypothetical protein